MFAEFELYPILLANPGEVISLPLPELDHLIIAKRIFLTLAASLGFDRVWPTGAGYRIAGGWIEPDVSIPWRHRRPMKSISSDRQWSPSKFSRLVRRSIAS
jgi:hypothetical protein